jgi:hypothetical protein
LLTHLLPENQKAKEGFLLGINLTEFIVVVLEIVDLGSPELTVADLKAYVDLPAFKTTVKHLINVRSMAEQSEIKVLGASPQLRERRLGD